MISLIKTWPGAEAQANVNIRAARTPFHARENKNFI